ncbi:putative ferruginol synthase [Helianthus annuus]|nr:putative ferruginol synthase [Helianthus annuus]KAJ0736498.1 putative ferruginol synthase [Helianthus annuus]KAJ0739447.1 putative ferruginol synthase [Helianthus annuus]KAJ0913783.1 putative ferruginol synthase [Helianthus annuus]
MEQLLFLILSCIIFFFFLLHAIYLHRNQRLPPGPAGLPIIGNLLDLGPKPHESLAKLSKTYGPLMTIRMGTITNVVASTPEAAREILQRNDEACSGRIIPDAAASLADNDVAMVWIAANDEWRTIRKALSTCLTHQHKLDTLRDLRQNVLEGMLEYLHECGRNKAAVDIGKLAFAVALNQMSNTCVSQNVTNYKSNDIGGFKTAVKTVMQVTGKFNIADIYPVLKPLDPQNIRQQGKVAYGWLDKVAEGFIIERLKYRESKLQRFGDMLDSLLDFSEKNEAEFTLKHIKILLVELFLAGTETSSNTTEWAMTELLLNPDMFSRVRKEVSTTVGEDGKIKEAKLLDLPYLQAVIKETMRLHLPVPLLVPHKTETRVKLGEYIVPKNTQILVNAWAMARDPRYWETPTMFKPERFLGNEIDYKGQHFQFIPFGSGRRMCPGIPLAHRVVSLMVASFVYHFDWKLPHAREEMDMNDIFGLTLLRATPLVATPIPVI